MGRLVLLVVLVGCYSPSVAPGGLCGTDGACPAGLMCFDGRCLPEAPEQDAALDAPLDGSRNIDAPLIDAPIDGPPGLGPWGTPTPVASINSGSAESDPTFSADRLTVAFIRSREIYLGTRASIASSFTVTHLASLGSVEEERGVELSADGNTLYFASDRIIVDDHEIYVSTRSGATWSAPVQVAELDTSGGIGDIAISPDQLTIIVDDGGFYRATRTSTSMPWGSLTELTINFGALVDPSAPSITANGDIYFHAGGTRDLYLARANGSGYDAPIAVTELNTTNRDASPAVSADGRYMMFERGGDIYETSR